MERGHRFQITLSDDEYALVAEIAHRRGASIASVIRDAIDIMYFGDSEEALAATRRLLADDVLAGTSAPLRW